MPDLLRRHCRVEAPADVLRAAEPYERRLGVRFESFTVFPRAALDELHTPPASGAALPPAVRPASADADELARCMATIARAARDPDAYREAVSTIFRHLPEQPLVGAADVLCVGPDGEGSRLALDYGCRGLFPTAKRIPLRDGGLIVGLTETHADLLYRECVLLDDKVETGATLIALMGALSHSVDRFRVFVAYAMLPGLWAISRYAEGAGLGVAVNVGHVRSGDGASPLAARSSNVEWYERGSRSLPLT